MVLKQVELMAKPLLVPVQKKHETKNRTKHKLEKQSEKHCLRRSLVHSRHPRGGFGHTGLDFDLLGQKPSETSKSNETHTPQKSQNFFGFLIGHNRGFLDEGFLYLPDKMLFKGIPPAAAAVGIS